MKRKRIGSAVMAMGMIGAVHAATITWHAEPANTYGSVGENLSPGLFRTNGVFVSAENVGGSVHTFDGISFAAGTTVFSGIYGGFHDNPASFETELSATGTHGSSGADTITLTGLSIGTDYRIQALVFDGRGDTGIPGRTVSFDGSDQGTYASGITGSTWGTGLLVSGFFTADAPTQAFTIEAFLGTTSKGGQLNALTLFEAPYEPPPPPPVYIEPVPTNMPSAMQQIQIDRAYGMFCHFGINTFHNEEWTDGSKPASSYAPTAVDADQWVRTAYESGMRYFLLISKHHDGFCMWDSPYTTYDVGSSGNTTDVVRAVADACEKYGVALALYYSLWDRHEASFGSPAYIDYMENQLTELLSDYGPVAELWLDGGWVASSSYWEMPRIYDAVKQLQPDCQVGVNWSIGTTANPDQHLVKPQDQSDGDPIRYFPSDFNLADPEMPAVPSAKLFTHGTNTYYMPFEATVTLSAQNKWFHNTGDPNAKSVDLLERVFDRCTTQDNLLVLNAPPNRDGVLIPSNIAALSNLAARVGLEPGRPVPKNLALGKPATASSVWSGDHATYGAARAVDITPNPDPRYPATDSRWASDSGSSTAWLEVDLGQDETFDRIIVNEFIDGGNRVQSFKIEYWDGTQWLEAANGTTIGQSLLLDFPEVTGSKVRLNILSASAEPSIWNFKVQFSNRGYRLWRESHFGSGYATNLVAQDTADPDDDGLPNILEYALEGYHPLTTDELSVPTAVSTNGNDYVEYRLEKRDGVSPEGLLGEYKSDLQAEAWEVPAGSGDGNVIVEDTADHWLLRMHMDVATQGFFRARTDIW